MPKKYVRLCDKQPATGIILVEPTLPNRIQEDKMMKRIVAVLSCFALLLGLCAAAPAAVAATSTAKPQIEKVEYEGNGRVEVDFAGKVAWKNPKVAVKDNTGKKYTATIRERDNDELDFVIANVKAGKSYTFTISGIRARGAAGTTKVTGEVQVPSAQKVRIKKTTYKGGGRVEVDFAGKVRYRNLSVTVQDSAGKTYTAKVTDRDSDELDFKVANLAAGKNYTYTISGVKVRTGGADYGSVSGKFSTPKASAIVVEDIDYDPDDCELSIDFQGKVQYSSPTVAVTDSAGNDYPASIRERDSDDMEIYVPGLEYGRQYTVKISGIKNRSASGYTTLTKTFTAVDD